ncbi:MAG: divergent polysaccharide deacetylase family protein [Candidatus Liberibacter ctenarytainae]|uniref:Divergent polysaccharide deacetylase family protein n=1 Tax=Candidatus Liberibacter ctenarytainae TaxID=2020335 RepID=A0A937AEZ0_9HYPH|nr:divergent polysaccharide deacetylase family protein [Candidatus Liberibacter ctenarytainae]
MSDYLNNPLGKKSVAKQSFVSKIVSRLSFCLLFYLCIIGLSIYIFISNPLNGIVSEVGKNAIIREDVSDEVRQKSQSSDYVVATEKSNKDEKQKNDSTFNPKNNSVEKEEISRPVRSTQLDSLPTIEGRLLSVVPKEDLLEKKGSDSLSPKTKDMSKSIENYNSSCSKVVGPRIAIVVSGLGISQTGTQRAINLLPNNVTLAFASNGNSLNRWMQEARKKGQETIVQIPMQAYDESNNGDDPYTLKVTQSASTVLGRLRYSLGRAMGYSGVMNYRGAMFLSKKDSSEVLFKEISNRGLFFFDDGSSPRNLTKELAPKFNLPYLIADLYLDDQVDRDRIRQKLKDLEDMARISGEAIGVAVAFDESIEVISKWLQEEHVNDISVVPLSCFVKSIQPLQKE